MFEFLLENVPAMCMGSCVSTIDKENLPSAPQSTGFDLNESKTQITSETPLHYVTKTFPNPAVEPTPCKYNDIQ